MVADGNSYDVDVDICGERVGQMAVQSSQGAPADSLIYRLMNDYFALQRLTLRQRLGSPERLTALRVMGWQAVLLAHQYTKKADLINARGWAQRAYSDGNMINDPELLGQAGNIAAIVEFHYGLPRTGIKHGQYILYVTRRRDNTIVRAMAYAALMTNAAKIGDISAMREAEQHLLSIQQNLEEPKAITTFALSPHQFYNSLGLAHEAIKSPDAALYFTTGEESMRPRDVKDVNGESFRWIFHFATTRSITHVQPTLALIETRDTLKKIAARSSGNIDGIYRDRARQVIAALPEGYKDVERIYEIIALIGES